MSSQSSENNMPPSMGHSVVASMTSDTAYSSSEGFFSYNNTSHNSGNSNFSNNSDPNNVDMIDMSGLKFESEKTRGDTNVAKKDISVTSPESKEKCIKNSIKTQEKDSAFCSLRGNLFGKGIELQESAKQLLTDVKKSSWNKDDFCLVISMADGQVLYTTPTLTNVLGFPKDMWLGRSFIDFVHPKDRDAFASHITSDIAAGCRVAGKSEKRIFFCRIRKYRGLKDVGFGVKDKEVEYILFRLKIMIKRANGDFNNSGTFLVITASPVKTAYTYPEEIFGTPKFYTKQTSDTNICYIDAEAVSYLGYLPQDLIGRSILDFYHPDDVYVIRDMYKSMIECETPTFKSKPYRFRAQNGCYVVLKTEWSNFINPWTKKLEFSIGQHNVLRGPANPDVFAPSTTNYALIEESSSETKKVKAKIKYLLNKPQNPSSFAAKHNISRRCKNLTSFIKELMEEVMNSNSKSDSSTKDEPFFAEERDSSITLRTSPQHVTLKQVPEEPPTYRQMSYNENIERFFRSWPKTGVDEENKGNKKSPDTASSLKPDKTLHVSESNRMEECSKMVKNQPLDSLGVNPKDSAFPSESTILTKALLTRHDDNMEKIMLKNYKIKRPTKTKMIKKLSKDKRQAVKRRGSDSWEVNKNLKLRHLESDLSGFTAGGNNFALWPPVPIQQQNGMSISSNGGIQIAGMIPVYYVSKDCPQSTSSQQNDMECTKELDAFNDHEGKGLPQDYLNPSNFLKPGPVIDNFAVLRQPPLIYPPIMLNPQMRPARLNRDTDKYRASSQNANGTVSDSQLSSFTDKEDESSRDGEKAPNGANGDSGTGDESSTSLFSSSIKTDSSNPSSSIAAEHREQMDSTTRPKVPSWLDNINVTPDLVFRYQLSSTDLNQILNKDQARLKVLNQPQLVEEQLQQLYIDLETAGLAAKLKIDSSGPSSCETSSGDDMPSKSGETKRRVSQYNYGQMGIIHEENMPMPPVMPTSL